ncbi:hypothetical protein [Nonomuraea africana]|uniref:hypothetical protein n=1 Tax=Nonomuraea africana TaxID=46171 RepID=UPI0033FEDFC3
MLVVFAFALLVLAAAIVVLFAMFGELASRVRDPASAHQRDSRVEQLEDLQVGRALEVWPNGMPHSDDATLLVLSTSCESCRDVATQLSSDPGHSDWEGVGLVISTAGRQTGENFIADFHLEGFPHFVDEGGDWSREELGVQQSPTAVVVRSGLLDSAYVFNDVSSLRSTLQQQKEVV